MSARRTLVGALAAVAVFPATAAAGRVEFDRWDVGLQSARAHWGGWPPCGIPTFEHHATGEDAYAWVTGPLTAPQLMPCVIHLAERAESLNPGDACAEVVHEVGHLFGHEHTDNPADVMFNGGAMWRAVWECRRAMHRVRYARACSRQSDGTQLCASVYAWVLSHPVRP